MIISFLIFVVVWNSAVCDIPLIQPRFATPCITPNHDQGWCVEIQLCPKFDESDIFNVHSSRHNFVVESKCGPRNDSQILTKVCCGKYDDFINTISTTTPPTTLQLSPFPEICGNQTIQLPSRILGGVEAGLTEFPWMARLRHRSASGLFNYGCAGFLISEYFVLTAAHCIISKSLAILGPIVEVQLGEYNTDTNPDCERRNKIEWCADFPQLIKVGKPKVHPEYSNNEQYHNDIAVLPLKEAAKLTEFVYPICLATELSQDNEMWLSGWGRTENRAFSPIKLKVVVQRSSKNYCVPKYRDIHRRILYSQICAGGEAGIDSCNGDSGGPLMVQGDVWYAEGVVSFGLGCGIKDWPAIYTNIPYYIPWIARVTKHYLKKHIETK